MNSLKVLVDWLLETVGCPHPGPASAAALDELRNHGVPEPLIDVYGVVGSDIPGLLPDPHELATVALLPPEAVCRHTKTALRGSQPCPFATSDLGSWAFDPDGTLVWWEGGTRTPAGPLHEVLERHLGRLRSGVLVYDPVSDTFRAPPESRAFLSALEGLTDEPERSPAASRR
ncbi:MAG: hypothetical protein KC656_12525 [Myxococcales bacterium]|nr:hypothetical protein [Myxococcales bacterium]